MTPLRVPYALNFYDEKEIEAVIKVLRSGSTMAGSEVGQLENSIASEFGHDFGIMVNSGSSALTLALAALELSQNAEVITPALTFSTTVASQLQAGLVPVLVDCEIDTLNIDVSKIEGAITENTEAIVVPDLMGNFSDWDQIRRIADRHSLKVLHDSADTIGHRLEGTPVGNRADISTTSLYGAHIINGAGNGGMVTTSNEQYARLIRKLRSWGRESALFGEVEDPDLRFNCQIDGIEYDNKFVFSGLGYNMEGSEISAAFGNVQYSKLKEFKRRRRKIFDLHLEIVEEFPDVFIQPRELDNADVVWYAFPFILKETANISRTDLQKYLESNQIQTRPVFAGNIARQPGFRDKNMRQVGSLDNADYIMRNALVVGCHQGMDERHVEWVHHNIRSFIGKNH